MQTYLIIGIQMDIYSQQNFLIRSTKQVKEAIDTMKKMIKIPSQIQLKTEFFEGYGIEELVKTIIILGVAVVIGYIIYLFTKVTLISTFFVIGSVVIAVVFLTKNRNNFSIADNIKNIIKYELIQKRYRYKRGNFNKTQTRNKNIK